VGQFYAGAAITWKGQKRRETDQRFFRDGGEKDNHELVVVKRQERPSIAKRQKKGGTGQEVQTKVTTFDRFGKKKGEGTITHSIIIASKK